MWYGEESEKRTKGAEMEKVEAIKRKQEEEVEIHENGLIHSFTKYVLSTYYEPGSIAGVRNTVFEKNYGNDLHPGGGSGE